MDVRETGSCWPTVTELRVVLLADEEGLGATSARVSPVAPSPPPHVHDRHADCFLVLDGAVRLDLAGEERIVEPQSWIQVPRGVVHTFGAAGEGPTTFVNVHTPSSGLGAYMRALMAAQSDEERRRAWDDFDARPAESGVTDPAAAVVCRLGGERGRDDHLPSRPTGDLALRHGGARGDRVDLRAGRARA